MLEFWFKHYAKYSLTRSNLFPEKGGGELSENKHLCVFFISNLQIYTKNIQVKRLSMQIKFHQNINLKKMS